MHRLVTILVLVVGLGLGGGVLPAAGAPRCPETAVVAAPAVLKPIIGPSLTLKRFACGWVVAAGPQRVLVLVPGRGVKVKVKVLKTLKVPGWPALGLVSAGGLPGPWWVELGRVKNGCVQIKALGWVARQQLRLVPGPVSIHHRRLKRLAASRLPRRLTERLLAGRVEVGDSMWLVEMALGMPQRSFMVNYFKDEQHYVYLRPGGVSILLRFKEGRLAGPLPRELANGR